MSSIYEGLVICHPKEHCSTWDFCTHYIPHVKGDACSCDSCVPCDMKTLLQHRVKIKEANIAARDKEWVEWVADEIIEFALNFNRSAAFHETLLRVWNNRKKEIEL